jgi:hypothetical protein
MKISGHKTDSMFRRYAIGDEVALQSALLRTQRYVKTVKESVVAMPAKLGPRSERGQFGYSGAPTVARRAGKGLKRNGSSGRTRTYNPPVNSRMLCH